MTGTPCDTLPPQFLEFSNVGFFAENPLMHPEIPFQRIGIPVETLPYAMRLDDMLVCTMLGCFLALVVLSRYLYPFLSERMHILFFFNPSVTNTPGKVETGMEFHARMFMAVLLSIMAGTLFYGFKQESGTFYLPYQPFWIPPALYSAYILTYFILKQQLYNIVNMVFFDKKNRNEWMREYSFLLSMETIATFVVAIFAIYANFPLQIRFWMLFIPLIFIKLFLIYKSYNILFGKLHCSLHFFVYFCALELIPITTLWVVLNKTTTSLIVN